MINLLFAAAFSFSVTGKTAVVYSDRLAVTPLKPDMREFTVEVAERPQKGEGGRVTMAP